jgi:8-oxo-dGTP diphosphatase
VVARLLDLAEEITMIHAAGVVLVRRDGAVLMQHRGELPPGKYWPLCWAYPAGHVEEDEDFESAARRELREETGYEVSELALLIEEEHELIDGKRATRHVFWAMYDDKQEIQCNEGLEMKFLTLEELKDKNLLPGNDRICALALERARKSGLITTFSHS